MMNAYAVNNDTFQTTSTQEDEEDQEDQEIGDPVVGLGKFHPIGDGGSGPDEGNAMVGSASSSTDGDIEDNKYSIDPLLRL